MSNAVRIQHEPTGRTYVVKGGEVYGDKDGDGKIAKSERLTSDPQGTSLAAIKNTADYFGKYFDNPYPGTKGIDAGLKSGGLLNAKEVDQFEKDPKGVVESRSELWGHVDFFDRKDVDGRVTVKENWDGWRALGYGFMRSAFGTAASAVIFGSARDGFAIDVEEIQKRRPKGSSGLYDKDTGRLDKAKMAEYLAEFDKKGGTLTHDELQEVLKKKANLGRVPKGQFQSLLELCEKMNGSKTITKAQFQGAFDSSLLYLAAEYNGNERR
jgi:hypothetical protein